MPTSYWMGTKLPRALPVRGNERYDVIVIGGGIMGITAAYLLKREGLTVALLERGRFAQIDTGHTTAHLTQVTDKRLTSLKKYFGADRARLTWDAGRTAIDQIERTVRE